MGNSENKEIEKVNLSNLKSKIDQYNTRASNITNDLAKYATTIESMKKVWTGATMNRVIDVYNGKDKQKGRDILVNKAVFFSRTVLNVLVKAYNGYAKEQQKAEISVKLPSRSEIESKIVKINPTDTTMMSYQESKVKKLIDELQSTYDAVKQEVEDASNLLELISGWSDNLTELLTRYRNNAQTALTTLNSIGVKIKTEANVAKKVVEQTESLNETDAEKLKDKK